MTTSPILEHPPPRSRLRGVTLHDGHVVQFCGIKLGDFAERYAESTEIDFISHRYASFYFPKEY